MFPGRYFAPRYFPVRYFASVGATVSTLVVRELPVVVKARILDQHTCPFYIVKLEFETSTSYLSETQQVTFESNVYQEGAIRVGSFSWEATGQQVGTIGLLNENNAATALVLNNTVQDVPISIYLVYSTGPSTTTDPILVVKGVMSGSSLGPEISIIGVLTSKAETEFAPQDFYTIEEGYNWLPPTGTVVTWAGEKYVLVGVNL